VGRAARQRNHICVFVDKAERSRSGLDAEGKLLRATTGAATVNAGGSEVLAAVACGKRAIYTARVAAGEVGGLTDAPAEGTSRIRVTRLATRIRVT